MTYAIQSGIPLPIMTPPRGPRYPFMEMEVGDSFEAPLDKRSSVASSAAQIKRKTGRRFTVRMWKDRLRVWRVA